MATSIFVTGASGFIGRSLVPRLLASTDHRITFLTRRPIPEFAAGVATARAVIGDLLDAATYRSALEDADIVIHLAAATGRASPGEFDRINVEGTRTLVAACQSANVRRFLHVSTIAAGYQDQRYSAYSKTKSAAEAIVRQSGLDFVILRPTIVLGAQSPVWLTLMKIAGLPVVPLPQGGRPVVVQPIHVDDVVRGIERIVETGRFDGEILELGGPSALPLSSFIATIQKARNGKTSKTVPVPLMPVRMLLALAEPIARAAMPVTAGQLVVFANDSAASSNWLLDELRPTMPTLEQTVARLLASEPRSRSSGGGGQRDAPRPMTDATKRILDQECVLFAAYLVNVTPTEYVKAQYRNALAARDFAFDEDFTGFDRTSLGLARKNRLLTRCVDAYCALFHRAGAVRCKLIVLAAILEHVAPASEAFDGRGTHGPVRTLAALVAYGTAFAVSAILGALLLMPAGVIGRLRSSGAGR
jgi:nucleoside-diphosphate-sugar epimerase